MSDALDLSDIVAMVMEHLEASKPALASCACVNRLFSQEALRLLWKSITGLTPFENILPKDDLFDRMRGNKLPINSLLAPVHDSLPEWRRITGYAALVRSIDFSTKSLHASKSAPPALVRLFTTFKASFPNQTLFPNLTIIAGLPNSFPALSALLSPCIRHLSFCGKSKLSWNDVVEDIGRMSRLESLVQLKFPQLEQVSSDSLTLDAMHIMFSTKVCLKTLVLDTDVTLGHLKLLQDIPELVHLRLQLDPKLIPEEQSTSSLTLRLPKLHTMTLYGTAEACTYVIQVLASPLERIAVLTSGFTSPDAFVALVSLIAQVWHLSLTKLGVLLGDLRGIPTDIVHHLSEILVPLKRMGELKELTLGMYIPVQISNADFLEVLKAPSKLRWLSINKGPAHEFPWYNPLVGPLALLCLEGEASQIRDLALYMNDDWRGLILARQDIIPYPKLVSLDVGFSLIRHNHLDYTVEEVVDVLATLFPNLKSVKYASKDEKSRQQWRDISDGLARRGVEGEL